MELLTAEQVMKQLGFKTPTTVRKLALERKIDVIIIGRNRRMFTQEAVDKFIKDHTLEAKS
jgi:hypothetical protein